MTFPATLASKRLVIFGCGYVGSAVAREAAAAGMRVTALTRNAATAAELRADRIETVVAELSSGAWHDAVAPIADFALNCVSAGGGGAEGYRRSYLEGMQSVLAWARRGALGTLIYTGSTSVYPQTGGVTVDENAAAGGTGGNADILRETEVMLENSGSTACNRWFVLRLAGIYGPGRHQLLDQLRTGATELPGGGEHHLNLIHRDDIVAAIAAALAAPAAVEGGIFNIADDGAATKAEVVRWLADRLGRMAPVFTGDGSGGRRKGAGAAPDRIISNAKAKQLLGWRPRFADFRAGYEAMIG